MSRCELSTSSRSRRCLMRRGRVWQTNTRRGGMTATVSATQLAQSILAIWPWSTPKATIEALKATRYCFASVSQRVIAVRGELDFGSFSFFARGDTVCRALVVVLEDCGDLQNSAFIRSART